MNLPIPTDSPLWIGIGATFLAMRPVFLALAILMLDWGERGLNRLQVLQSLSGKAPPLGNPTDRRATDGKKGLPRRERKERTEDGGKAKIRKDFGR